ncbi:MAG: MG2 domain-containing protein [Acidobacteriota bacterium]
MRPAVRRVFGCLLLAASVTAKASSQSTQLTIVSSGPTGELVALTQANEIRVIFSEPMVPLGRIPSNPTPEWIHISPAIKGVYRWSGTTILIFTPDPATPLPNATTYTVTADASAAAVSGRTLGAPHRFTFTTPTVKLTSARWARPGDRFDAPVTLALMFNQAVRPQDVIAHLRVQYRPHDVDLPAFTPQERARLTASDPDGLRRFDAKIGAARAAAARTDAVGVRVATSWDEKRFPPSRLLVVLETTTVPPPGTWLQLTLDDRMPSADGPALPPDPQSSVAELPPLFFVMGPGCRNGCDPSDYNAILFSDQVEASRMAATTSVRDVTDPSRERAIGPTTSTRPRGRDTFVAHSLEELGFDRQPPATTWLIGVNASLQAFDGQTLGYPWIGIVENWHERAFTGFGDGHGVWETGGGPQLPFYARNFQTVTQHATRLAAGDLMPRTLELEKAGFRTMPPGPGTLRKLNVTPDQIQSHGLDLKSLLTPQGTGLVWAGMNPGEAIPRAAASRRPRSTIVQVTNLGITVKDSPQSTLVFVTRLDNGEPVADARVTIVNTKNEQVWRGATGRDGVVVAPALPIRTPEKWHELSFIVTAEKDGDLGYAASNWNEGIMPWDFGHSFQLWEATDILRGSIFTDRGVYKPGETIHVKAIVRSDTPTGIRMFPAGSTLDVRVFDSRNKEVDRRSITINRWSSAEWEWAVPSDATLGSYRIETMLPGTERPPRNDVSEYRPNGDWLHRVYGSFLVAAYRKPDFRVDTTLSAASAVAGSALNASATSRYLFGNPLARRPVTWSLTRVPDLSVPAAILERYPDDKYEFGYYPAEQNRGEVRVAGETTALNQTGGFTVELPTERGVDFANRYTFEADVEDISRQHIANRSSIVVYPAPFHIGLRRPAYFADTKTGTSIDVIAVDPKGAPIEGVPVTLTLVRIQWNSVRRAEGSGFYSWDTERLELPSGEWTVTSAATPVPVKIPVPEGGYYELRAIGRDSAGRQTRTDASFYGLGAGYTAWERFDHNRITLEPEKKTWKPGERARIMIQSPWETATALLTIEREGIRRYERFTLSSTQQTVEVPITEAEIPNVFVSVLLIRGRTSSDPGKDGSDPGKPAFRLGYTELLVNDESKKLGVTVSADRPEYRPANTAKVSVTVRDAAGRPSASEVTLWAVDHGVLSLTGYEAPDVVSSIYLRKSLQVLTEDSRQRIISRRVLTPKGGDEGGGGGKETGFRQDFRPLAFWLGSVETDRTGRATKDVTLPESLTTYRIMAVAGDPASRFGSASAEIRVSKPVTMLAAFPRFLTLGDHATFGAVVSNTLPAGGSAAVTIRSLDPAVLEFSNGRQALSLEGGANEEVRFDAIARGTGRARVQMTVRLGSNTDAFEMTLPVIAPARLETTAAFGETVGRATERLTIPAGIVPALGGLNVELSSSALAGLGEGARYLADYPYWCAEQKASAALALVLAADLGQAFEMPRIAPADYRKRAAELLRDLPRYQCSDGGFGYWPGRCAIGSFYLTSYVLHVMHTAEGLGLPSESAVVSRALDYLDRELKRPAPLQVQWLPAWGASAAYATKVLTAYGRPEDSNITRLLGSVDRLPVFALSYLADAMAASPSRGPRYGDVLRRLTNALRVEGDRTHVEENDSDALAWIWNSNVRATAQVLSGLVERGDDPQLVPGLVRWLLLARQNGRWSNTQENAMALHALVGYYRKYEAETPDMTATVALADRAIGTAAFRGRSSATRQVRLAMPDLIRQVAAGTEAELAISRAGTGRLYYSARLQYAPSAPLPVNDQGIRIERRYERFVENGDGPATTSFAAGDLIRVTLALTLPKERRYVAVTDSLPAGVEAVDGWFNTTAADLARDASVDAADQSFEARWRRGGFDHIEKYDERIALFATRLSEGRHEFSYLVRATTAGTFRVAGTWAEEMYAPEVNGRSEPATIVIKK